MKTVIRLAAEYLAAVPDQLRQRKWLTLLAFLIVTGGLASGIPQLKFDFTVDSWFDPQDPTFVARNALNDQFGGDDGVLIVYKPKDGDVFSEASLKAVKGIRDELLNANASETTDATAALSHITEVDTLINAPVLTADGDILYSSPLVGDDVPESAEALEAIRATAESQRDLVLQFYSRDMQYGAINIETDFGSIPLTVDNDAASDVGAAGFAEDGIAEIDMGAFEVAPLEAGDDADTTAGAVEESAPEFKATSMADYVALHEAIKRIINKPEYADHFEYYAVGNTVDSENQVKMGEEMGLLYLMAVVIMIVLLFLLFRSGSGVLWPLFIIIFSILWTLGAAGHLGLAASPFIVFTILLLLTIGMADAIHIISGYLYCRNHGDNHVEAMRGAYRKAGLACLMTTLTTVVGLMALTLSDLVPVQNFGYTSSIGVVAALLLTIYVLPVLMEFWTPMPKQEQTRGRLLQRLMPNPVPKVQAMLDAVVPMVEKRPLTVVIPFMLVFATCVYGSFHTRVDYSLTDAYTKDSRFYQSVELIDEKMAGATRIALYLDLKTDNGLQDPTVLKTLDELMAEIREKYSKYVVTTSSVIDVVKDANQKLHGGDEAYYRIPDTRRELSQTLFLFNIADPDNRASMVDEQYRKGNFTITLRNYGSHEYNPVFKQMNADIDAAMQRISADYPDATMTVTGMFALGMKASDYIIITQLESFATALLAISVVLLMLFSSFKAGVVSLIPNLIPSFLTLGILGLTGYPLDFYTMMLAPLVIGISVDDTIHFITHYRQEVIKDGNIRRALRHTIKECGQAVLFTSLVLGLGFGIMAIATTPGIANLGKFGFLCVMAGLLNDLFLTPALILLFKLRFGAEEPQHPDSTAAQPTATANA